MVRSFWSALELPVGILCSINSLKAARTRDPFKVLTVYSISGYLNLTRLPQSRKLSWKARMAFGAKTAAQLIFGAKRASKNYMFSVERGRTTSLVESNRLNYHALPPRTITYC
jgi:hypothetical protein